MKRKASKREKKREAKKGGEAKSPVSLLRKFDPPSDGPYLRDPALSLTVRVFERESELKGAFKREFALQLEELFVCSLPECGFRYVEGEASDPTVRMLVHHYLHLAREGENRVKILALNRMAEILDPPRERVTSGLLESGVLTPEEKRFLKLSKTESKNLS